MREDDEIDLVKLVLQIKKLVIKNIVAILILVTIGVAAGYVYDNKLHDIYRSNMMIRSDIMTTSVGRSITDELHLLIGQGRIVELASRLQITQEEASAITYLFLKTPELANGGIKEMTIELKTKKPADLPTLQKAIVGYLERNEFYQNQVELKKKFFKNISSKIDEEISDFDKNKKAGTASTEVVNLFRQKFLYLDSLTHIGNVVVIIGFSVYENTSGNHKMKSLLGGAFLGLLLSLMWIGIRNLPKSA